MDIREIHNNCLQSIGVYKNGVDAKDILIGKFKNVLGAYILEDYIDMGHPEYAKKLYEFLWDRRDTFNKDIWACLSATITDGEEAYNSGDVNKLLKHIINRWLISSVSAEIRVEFSDYFDMLLHNAVRSYWEQYRDEYTNNVIKENING